MAESTIGMDRSVTQVFYNTNTERTVKQNRLDAILYLIENYAKPKMLTNAYHCAVIANVRYREGYRIMYIVSPGQVNSDFVVAEYGAGMNNVWYVPYNGTGATLYTATVTQG